MLYLQVAAVLLTALAMALAVAHALEYPGKMRLNRENYLVTQTIYYPGFTIGGIGEALAVVVTLALTLFLPHDGPAFWWSAMGFLCLASMHAIFWFVTQPVNRYWTANLKLSSAAQHFFQAGGNQTRSQVEPRADEWQRRRSTWEYSHIIRAVFAALGLLCITVAIILYGQTGVG
ncbi:MAG: DUF1772 domain-containing protein [Acidobacteria bacterium]|nr:DUF1772 domain-containing protein [Acidobacteriota bacterium]